MSNSSDRASHQALRKMWIERFTSLTDFENPDTGRCPGCGIWGAQWFADCEPVCPGDDPCSPDKFIAAQLADYKNPAAAGSEPASDGSEAHLAAIPEYPIEALPGPAQELVLAAVRDGLPAALVAGAAIGAMAAAIGGGPSIDVFNQRAILWIALVAPSGSGKSPAQTLAFQPLRDLDRKSAQNDRPRMLLGDMTIEALARELNSHDGSGAIDLDELAVLLRGLGEYKRRGGGDRARFLGLWTGGPLLVARVAGGATTNKTDLYVPRPTLSIVGTLQPHLRDLFGSDEDGSPARWLPHLAAMSDAVDELPATSGPQAWTDLLEELVARRGQTMVACQPGERPWFLTDAAKRTMADFRSKWKRQARGMESATVNTALSKADIHLARFALVFAEASLAGGLSVDSDVIERAARAGEFTLDCWRALPVSGGLSLSRRDGELDDGIAKLVAWLDQRKGEADKDDATKGDVLTAHVGGIRTAQDRDAVLERYEAIYPGSVTQVMKSGNLTTVVRAPRRSGGAGS